MKRTPVVFLLFCLVLRAASAEEIEAVQLARYQQDDELSALVRAYYFRDIPPSRAGELVPGRLESLAGHRQGTAMMAAGALLAAGGIAFNKEGVITSATAAGSGLTTGGYLLSGWRDTIETRREPILSEERKRNEEVESCPLYAPMVEVLGNKARAREYISDLFAGWSAERLAGKYISNPEERAQILDTMREERGKVQAMLALFKLRARDRDMVAEQWVREAIFLKAVSLQADPKQKWALVDLIERRREQLIRNLKKASEDFPKRVIERFTATEQNLQGQLDKVEARLRGVQKEEADLRARQKKLSEQRDLYERIYIRPLPPPEEH